MLRNKKKKQKSSSRFDNFSQKKVRDTTFLSEKNKSKICSFSFGILQVYICRIFKLDVNDKRRLIWVVKILIDTEFFLWSQKNLIFSLKLDTFEYKQFNVTLKKLNFLCNFRNHWVLIKNILFSKNISVPCSVNLS